MATAVVRPWSDESVTDLPGRAALAGRMLAGELPYRDVPFEYPPLLAPFTALAGIGGTGVDQYRLGLAVVTLAFAFGVAWLCAGIARALGMNGRTAFMAAAAAPFLLGAVLRSHLDLVSVVLLLTALLMLLRERPAVGLALIGAGAMTKAFPLAAAPVVLTWVAARGGAQAMLRPALALAATVATLALGALALSPSGAHEALRYQAERPVQIESTPSLLAMAVSRTPVRHSHGSVGIHGASARAFAVLLLAALVALLALTCIWLYRAPTPAALVFGSLGAVVAAISLGKVLSPQFLAWVVPLFALAVAARARALAVVSALALLLTLAVFPAWYPDLVDGSAAAKLLYAVRNASLVAAAVVACASIRGRARESARSTGPGRRPPPLPTPR